MRWPEYYRFERTSAHRSWTPSTHSKSTENREAFHLFPQAFRHANKWTAEGLRTGIGCCWVFVALLFIPLNAQSQESLIDNFDAADGLQHWIFSNGAEFPGASGTLSLGPGHEGRGAVLRYRFTCLDLTHCGHYVAAIWKAPSPLDANVGTLLSLWVRLSPDVQLTIRITDRTGQTLQFHAKVPVLEQRARDEWQQIVLPITGKAEEHWGGANSGTIQDHIVEIALLADSLYIGNARGEIAFDDLRLLRPRDSTFVLNRTAILSMAPEGAAGLRARLGVNIHLLKDDRALDLARDAGFGFVRTDLPWAKLESHGQYDFAPFDGLMRSLEERGMGVLWVLDYGHPEHGGTSPISREDVEAYARYSAAVVSHFRGHNARFEVWNEPNGKQFLANPAIYPDLLRAALEAIRLHDPRAAVSTGGTSGFDFPFLASMLNSGAAQKASALAVHPYRDSEPETLPADLFRLRGLIRRTVGSNLPVWDTEWGYSSYSDPSAGFSGGHSAIARNRQAVLTARECLTIWVLGLPLAVLYDLRDDGSNPFNREDNFGLLNQDNTDKPVMKALRALTSVAQSHTYTGVIRDVPYGMHILRLDGADDIVFVAWSDNAQIRTRIRFSREEVLSISNIFGESIVPERNEVAFEESMGPVYLRLKRQPGSASTRRRLDNGRRALKAIPA